MPNESLPDPIAIARNLTSEELLRYEERFGPDSREWLIAQRELARRKPSTLKTDLVALGLFFIWASAIYFVFFAN